jgi:DNA-binding NtrC family response regulator
MQPAKPIADGPLIHHRGARPRLLIVDDEPRLRDLLMDVVADMGFTPTSARSAEEARKMMEAEPAHIVMLDLQLPVLSGMEFFEQIHRQWPATQVIIMTGFGDLTSAQQAIRLGVVDFISKPFHLRDVEVALDRAKKRLAVSLPLEETVDEEDEKAEPTTLAELERQAILAALERHAGNRTAAAAELGISRRKLHYWLNENHTADDE